jgi:hypothetical protein
MTIHHTVGVYPDGSYKQNGVSAANLAHHIAYNKEYRPGRALFVDKRLIHRGNLSGQRLTDAITLVAGLTPITEDTAPYR